MSIPLSQPHITDREQRLVEDAMIDGWISGTGPHVSQFECGIGERTARAHVLAVSSGTTALELAFRGLDIGPGDEVIVPDLTFAATASSVLAVGARAVLADISPDSWTLDPAAASDRMSSRTKAIVAVDLLGHAADYDALCSLGPPVVQDAAQAHGAGYRGAPVGSQGVVSAFSYHANKAVSTGEGGSVGTDDPELAARMRLIMNHGMASGRPYVHDVLGRNFRLNNLSAAVGVAQVERWEELTKNRTEVSHLYDELLTELEAPGRPKQPWSTCSCWLHVISVDDPDSVTCRLQSRGVDSRPIWPPLHRQQFIGGPVSDNDFPVASAVSASTIWLPTFSGMAKTSVEYVAECVKSAVTSGSLT